MSADMPHLTPPHPSPFAGLPARSDLNALEAHLAILGIPYVSPYPNRIYQADAPPRPTAMGAPAAIRRQAAKLAGHLDHHDFDFDGQLLAGKPLVLADCGDCVLGTDLEANLTHAAEAVSVLVTRGCVPVILGGDHGTTIPVLRGYKGHGPVHVVQIDAHIDWRDEREGLRYGYNSPMRRASEMPWVQGMTQIGLRGIGSARQTEVEDARRYGSDLVTAETLHREGVAKILERIPAGRSYFLDIDADGLDPALAPGVLFPTPGGVTYDEIVALVDGLASRGRIVGIDFLELIPERDVSDLTAFFAAQLLLRFIGILAHRSNIG